MKCRYATKQTDGAYFCEANNDECRFLKPDEKECYERYGDGPIVYEGEEEQ